MARFTAEEKRRILAEVDAAPQGGKQEIYDRHGVSRPTLSKWRRALGEGSLGRPRGRKKHPGWEAAVERLDKAPEALEAVRDADPDLAASDLVPARAELHKRILDEIAGQVVRGGLPWGGDVDDYDGEPRIFEEDAKANARIRLSRKRGREKDKVPLQGETDWLGDRRLVTWSDLCRRGDCPCARLCGVKHLHADGGNAGEALAKGVPTRPPRIVCLSRTCEINRHCLSWKFGNVLHLHWPKLAEADTARARPVEQWTSPEDCPWHGACDPAHARIGDSAMIPFDEDLHYAYPVEHWCIDPACGHHRRGMPHVHCAVCGKPIPFLANKHELDLSEMKRVDFVKPGPLCDKHYLERRDKLVKRLRRRGPQGEDPRGGRAASPERDSENER